MGGCMSIVQSGIVDMVIGVIDGLPRSLTGPRARPADLSPNNVRTSA
jgi:hypothetical protein